MTGEQGREAGASSGPACKLCGSSTRPRFTAALGHGLTGEYFECLRCQFLQSHHLDGLEARRLVYQQASGDDDVGAAWRQYCVATRLAALDGLLRDARGEVRSLDVGSGPNFVPAFLAFRRGWRATGYEPFSSPSYRPGLSLARWDEVAQRGPYRIVSASEVIEHFTDPVADLERIAAVMDQRLSALYVTTTPYLPGRHAADWPYLAPHTAQHCSFYSRAALRRVGGIIGARLILNFGGANEWLFLRGAGPLRSARARLATAALSLRLALRGGVRFDG